MHLQSKTRVPIALFIFIPFCKIKCTYCDFNVYANLAHAMEPYTEAVAREISGATHFRNALHRTQANASPLPRAKSIYLGGGTPSIMPIVQIEKILRACRESFSILPDAEITLEANPGTMDAAKLRDLHSLGINRLSIGVQSFDDAILKRLNRGHTAADAITTYDDARSDGFDNISLDFIYGLPLQTIRIWRETLDRALALKPEHLSLYALKVEEGTGLQHEIKRGKYPMPNDDLAADMYSLSEEMLAAAGYEHYEISNWARKAKRLETGDSISQSPISNLQSLVSNHNLTYWLNQPYLGFGAGAHSYFSGARFWNVLSPLEYIARVGRGESVEGGREEIGRELEMAETMILGLRLSRGIVFDEFLERFGEDARLKYAVQLHEVGELGLVEPNSRERSGVRLTPRGRLLSNEVFWRFLP